MSQIITCERHPEERVLAQCMNCKRGICRICREEYGYFCSEECKQQTQQETETLTKPEEREEFAVLEQRVSRCMRIFYRMVLPGLVVFVTLTIVFKATSRAGKVLWEFRPDQDKPLSALTSYKGNIYVGCDDGTLYSVNKQDGTVRWKFKAEKSLATAKPAILKDKVCVTWDETNVYLVEAEKGSLVSKRALPGKIAGGPITGKNAIFYISNSYRELTPEERKKLRRRTRDSFFPFSGTDNIGKIKVASTVYAVDCSDGHNKWTRKLDKDSYPRYFTSKGDNLYLSLYGMKDEEWGHNLLTIDATTGKGKWKAELGSSFLSEIYSAENGLLVVSNKNLHFISPEGKEIWSRSIEQSGFWRPIVGEGKIIFTEEKNKLMCLELATGKKLWTAEVPSLTSEPVISEELVFVPGFIEQTVEKGGKSQVKMPQPKAPGFEKDFLGQYGAQPGPRVKVIPMLYALDMQTGKTVWTRKHVGGQTLYDRGKVFVIRSSSSFRLLDQQIGTSNLITAIDPRKGKRLWQYAHQGFVNSTVIDEKTFCFSSSSATMHMSDMFSMKPKKPTDNVIYALSIVR